MADVIDLANELAEWQLEQALRVHRPAVEEASSECDDCGEQIPAARLAAVPGCRTCVDCQSIREVRRG